MTASLIETIRASVIGRDTALHTPFGLRRLTYADYTASGRSLRHIEEFIATEVLPLYANTHTETSGTGLQTTRFREDARAIIRRCVGATEEHAVIFAGSGSTGAIDRLITILGLRIPAILDEQYDLSSHIPTEDRPVVFVGPYEHHSNELPWRESICDVIEISEDADGHVDLDVLEARLVEFADRPLRIGSFSAASNVTGITSDTRAIASLLHRHGALSFWDFAAAAPYVEIDMVGSGSTADHLDAVFISPHKFIGGPGTPGLLIVRRDLLHNRVPAVPGGGTVAYVNPESHRYIADAEHREEGGTPAIVESIRAGLVFQLKEQVGVATIREHEDRFVRRAIAAWQQNPGIRILGNPDADRLSIVSFLVRAPTGTDRYLHHNFVVAVLNDLFGIQARGGCSCAGPYGHRLLGIDLDTSHRFEQEIANGCEVVKPGWVRVNFNYFISDEECDFIIEAVNLVAEQGWKLLDQYVFEPASALWRHVDGLPDPPLSLHDIRFDVGGMSVPVQPNRLGIDALAQHVVDARAVLADAQVAQRSTSAALAPAAELLRWFPIPGEVIHAEENP